MTDPKKDEHIEELLSKLQGIFSKLSRSDEEEAKQTIEIPTPAPQEPPPKESNTTPPPKKSIRPEIEVPPPASPPITINLYQEQEKTEPRPPAAAAPPLPPPEPSFPTPPPTPEPLTIPTPEPPTAPVPSSAPAPAPATPVPSGEPVYETLVPTEDPERMIVSTALFFPIGRENEGRSLAGKLETMAPKFTKVAFRLRVIVFNPYDPKSDWKEAIHAKASQTPFQTVFVAVDRALEDAKKKVIAGELEAKNIYFQEVPINMIEKKAFYTDILLGLVFFFDSRKPPSSSDGAAA